MIAFENLLVLLSRPDHAQRVAMLTGLQGQHRVGRVVVVAVTPVAEAEDENVLPPVVVAEFVDRVEEQAPGWVVLGRDANAVVQVAPDVETGFGLGVPPDRAGGEVVPREEAHPVGGAGLDVDEALAEVLRLDAVARSFFLRK